VEFISVFLQQVLVLLSIWWIWLQIQEHRRKKQGPSWGPKSRQTEVLVLGGTLVQILACKVYQAYPGEVRF
jgi:hypothetical protein